MAENGLYDVLRMGLSSLRAQSRAIETVGRNMANVNNPTYSRQRVIFGDVSPTGSASVGVDVIDGLVRDHFQVGRRQQPDRGEAHGRQHDQQRSQARGSQGQGDEQ